MRVELDVFSGRPNPTWELSKEQVHELITTTLSLHPSKETPHERDLGYRGLILRTEKYYLDLPQRIDIFKGIIVIEYNDGTSKVLEDTGRVIEYWLLKTGQHRIEPCLFKHIEKDIRN
jgi:hypothetical protein